MYNKKMLNIAFILTIVAIKSSNISENGSFASWNLIPLPEAIRDHGVPHSGSIPQSPAASTVSRADIMPTNIAQAVNNIEQKLEQMKQRSSELEALRGRVSTLEAEMLFREQKINELEARNSALETSSDADARELLAAMREISKLRQELLECQKEKEGMNITLSE